MVSVTKSLPTNRGLFSADADQRDAWVGILLRVYHEAAQASRGATAAGLRGSPAARSSTTSPARPLDTEDALA